MANKVTKYTAQVPQSTIVAAVFFSVATWLAVFVGPWYLGSLLFHGTEALLAGTLIFCGLFWKIGAFLMVMPVHIYDLLNSNPNNQVHINRVDGVYRQLLSLIEKLPVQKEPLASGLLARLAQTQLSRGDYERARYYYEKGLANLGKQKRLPGYDYKVAVLKNNRGVAYLAERRYVEAELDGTEAMESLQAYVKQNPKRSHPSLLVAPLTILGTASMRLGELAQAENYYREALAHLDHPAAFKGMHSAVAARSKAGCELTMALIKSQLELIDEALTYTHKALDVFEQAPEEVDPQALVSLRDLAEVWIALDEKELAERILKIAYAIGKVCPYHKENGRTTEVYAKLLRLTGREEEVELMKQWLLE